MSTSGVSTIMQSNLTLRLIQLYHAHYPDIARNNQDSDGRNTKQVTWAKITDELNSTYDTNFSAEQFKKKVQNVQCTSRQKLYSGKRNLGDAEIEYLRLFETDKIQPEVLLQRAKSRRSQSVLMDSLMTNSQDLSIADVSEDYKLTLRPDDDFIDIIGPYNNDQYLDDGDEEEEDQEEGEEVCSNYSDSRRRSRSSLLPQQRQRRGGGGSRHGAITAQGNSQSMGGGEDPQSAEDDDDGVGEEEEVSATGGILNNLNQQTAQQLLMTMVANASEFQPSGHGQSKKGAAMSELVALVENFLGNGGATAMNNDTGNLGGGAGEQQHGKSGRGGQKRGSQQQNFATDCGPIEGSAAMNDILGGEPSTPATAMKRRRKATAPEFLGGSNKMVDDSSSMASPAAAGKMTMVNGTGTNTTHTNTNNTTNNKEKSLATNKKHSHSSGFVAGENDQQETKMSTLQANDIWHQQMLKMQQQMLENQQSLMELFLKALGDRSTTLESQKREKNEREKIGSQLQALCGKVDTMNGILAEIAGALKARNKNGNGGR